MLFCFQPVLTVPLRTESASELYVATDMSPIERANPTQELRAAIAQSSPQVQALFEQVMRRSTSSSE